MTQIEKLTKLVSRIPNRSSIGIPPDYSFVPMEMIRALIRRKLSGLNITCVPIGGLGVDLLIGAGCVDRLEAAAVSLGEAGLAPQFTLEVIAGSIKMVDSTCPAIHTGLQAAEKGVPFMPLGGLIGSDIVRYRKDWKVIEDPLDKGCGRIILIPAIKPDFAVIHSPFGDKFGNVWVGKRRELITLAHASAQTLATVEKIIEKDLLADEILAAGTLSNIYVTAVSEVPLGAKPLPLTGSYEGNFEDIIAYADLARSKNGFAEYAKKYIFDVPGE